MDLAFTAEGSDASPQTLSLRGLDYSSYYRPNGVLNCGAVPLRQYLLSTLRHWVLDYGVDGFCFSNAENMAQGEGRVLCSLSRAAGAEEHCVLSAERTAWQPDKQPRPCPAELGRSPSKCVQTGQGWCWTRRRWPRLCALTPCSPGSS